MVALRHSKLKRKLFATFFGCLGASGVLVAINLLAEEHLPYIVKLASFFVVTACVLIGIGCIVALQVIAVRGWIKGSRAP